MGRNTDSLRTVEDANSKGYNEYLHNGYGDLVEADCQITGGGSSSGNKLLKKVGAVLGVTIPALAVLGACGVDKPAVIEESPEPGEIEKPGDVISPTEVTSPAEKPTETPGFDNDNGLPSPESFIGKIKEWGYIETEYIGEYTRGRNLTYVYKSKDPMEGMKIQWSRAIINTVTGNVSLQYSGDYNPLDAQ